MIETNKTTSEKPSLLKKAWRKARKPLAYSALIVAFLEMTTTGGISNHMNDLENIQHDGSSICTNELLSEKRDGIISRIQEDKNTQTISIDSITLPFPTREEIQSCKKEKLADIQARLDTVRKRREILLPYRRILTN